ncbi:MBOAT family O-acyltransferase [Persicobacter diffluens]|uniref:Alginate O-acetyltransferase n=1 Tax=Persicobacter diffluens TaxID=981 RepID=A0AAN4W474_9BACT|nr:alginate O-acetyltransferase [Persicobacter diffluens]
MSFTSSEFLIVVFLSMVFTFLIKPLKVRQLLLLSLSYFFYAAMDSLFVWLLLLITVVFYLLGKWIEENPEKPKKQIKLLGVGVILVIAILSIFKLQYLFSLNGGAWLLPVGVSFYSFQAISYLVDIYKNRIKAEKEMISFALYLSFYPQILSGPIERAQNLLSQLKKLQKPSPQLFIEGGRRIVFGYFCKLIIANKVFDIVSPIMDSYERQNTTTLLFSCFLYYMYIFFDFSGYTNIAIGVANTMGIRLSENFNKPFLAISLKDFWHRWHITLSTWFRDYLFIPLGGSKSKYKYVIVIFVFMVSGLWHGPTYNFILWGVYHGLLYVVEQLVKKYIPFTKYLDKAIVFRQIVTTSIISLGWICFYFPDYSTIINVYKHMIIIPLDFNFSTIYQLLSRHNILLFILLLFSIFIDTHRIKYFSYPYNKLHSKHNLINLMILDIQIISIFLLGDIGQREFVYFQF